MLKKRLPEPQDRSILGPVTASASDDPADGTDTTTGTNTTDTTKNTDTTKGDTKNSDTTTGTGDDKTPAATNGTLTDVTGTTPANTTVAVNTTSSTPPKADPTTPLPVSQPGTTTVIQSQTKTATVDDPENTNTADRTGASSHSDDTTKNMTMTIIIGVAASVGAIAIMWTIFRKWKLSSSKKFDRRLNPNWTPPTDVDDSPLPTHRRRASGASTRSGYGTSNNGTSLDQDLTAGPAHLAPVGGYADLARGGSPNPQMQEHHMRGFDRGVPLHHQGGAYGNQPPFDAYDYNGQGVRY